MGPSSIVKNEIKQSTLGTKCGKMEAGEWVRGAGNIAAKSRQTVHALGLS